MTRGAKLRVTLEMIGDAFGLYETRENDAVLHEIAHSLLLFGRMRHRADAWVSDRIEVMSGTQANDHEMKTMALQLAAMQALRCPWWWFRGLLLQSWQGLQYKPRNRKYIFFRRYVQAVRQATPSPMLLDRYVSLVRTFERYV